MLRLLPAVLAILHHIPVHVGVHACWHHQSTAPFRCAVALLPQTKALPLMHSLASCLCLPMFHTRSLICSLMRSLMRSLMHSLVTGMR